MARPICHLCDQPATVHETLLNPGGAVERHYCKVHGGSLWGAALLQTRPKWEPDPNARGAIDDLRRDESRGGR